MTSRETLECRIYMAEDAMHRRSDELSHHLHQLESQLKGLTAGVHHMLCEAGRTPLESKTRTIVHAVAAFEAGTDLAAMSAEGERLTSLKGLIDDYARQLAQGASDPGPEGENQPALEVLAATGS